MKPIQIEIDEDTGHSDSEGGFKSFQLVATGSTLWELLEDAHICEVDQDGGDARSNTLSDYPDAVIRTCEKIIAERFLERTTAMALAQNGKIAQTDNARLSAPEREEILRNGLAAQTVQAERTIAMLNGPTPWEFINVARQVITESRQGGHAVYHLGRIEDELSKYDRTRNGSAIKAK